MQYRRIPLSLGYSPSELLNGRQIRAKIDVLQPSPAHIAQGKQAKEATKSQMIKDGDQVEKWLQFSRFELPATLYISVSDVTKTLDGYRPLSP